MQTAFQSIILFLIQLGDIRSLFTPLPCSRITIEKTIIAVLMSAELFSVCLAVFSGMSLSDLEDYYAIQMNFRA